MSKVSPVAPLTKPPALPVRPRALDTVTGFGMAFGALGTLSFAATLILAQFRFPNPPLQAMLDDRTLGRLLWAFCWTGVVLSLALLAFSVRAHRRSYTARIGLATVLVAIAVATGAAFVVQLCYARETLAALQPHVSPAYAWFFRSPQFQLIGGAEIAFVWVVCAVAIIVLSRRATIAWFDRPAPQRNPSRNGPRPTRRGDAGSST